MKEYTQEQVDALIDEVKEQFLKPALEAAEKLVKTESGKLMPDNKEGNGGMVKDEIAVNSNMGGNAAPTMTKEESSVYKDESPVAAPASDEKSKSASSGGDDAGGPPAPTMEGSKSDSSSDSSSSSSSSSSGSPEGAEGDVGSLEQAYGELSDEDLKAHLDALNKVIATRMGQAQQGGAPAQQPPAAPPMGAAPAMGGAPAEAPPAAAQPPPDMAMKSEKQDKAFETLSKAETKINSLEKQLADVTSVLELLLTPQRKAVVSKADYLAKSADENPDKKQLTKAEIRAKLTEKSKTPNLKKSDQDLITNYFLTGNVNVDQIKHLLE